MTEERFIKLTQRDNRSIWLNARFIVTIEPNKDGGALVVPMGDGMDYEVRESAETVVSLCAGEVVAAPKPGDAQRKQQQQQKQPQQQGAQKQPDRQDAQKQPPAQKPESRQQPSASSQPPAHQPPAKSPAEGEKASATTVAADEGKPGETMAEPAVSEAKQTDGEDVGDTPASAAVAEPSPAIAVSPAPAEEAAAAAEAPAKPAKKARTAKAKKSAADAKPAEEKSAEERPAQTARKPGGAQSDDEVLARAAKLACRSRTRLVNMLKSQFGKTEDAAAALVAAWAEKGELSIDGNGHVEWKNRKGVAE